MLLRTKRRTIQLLGIVLVNMMAACLGSAHAAVVPAFGVDAGKNLYSLNLVNGNATLIGATGQILEGLALSPGGQLFGTDFTGSLYSINTTTGAATLVGSTGQGDIEGLAFSGNTLLGVRFNDPHTIFSINTTNATTSPVVTLSGTIGAVRAMSIENPATVLIETDLPTQNTLRSASLVSGNTTILGTMTASNVVTGLGFGADGNFYGVSVGGDVIRINPANGSSTLVTNNGIAWLDLATSSPLLPAAPEPGSLSLAAIGVAALALRRKRSGARRAPI